MSNTTIWNCFAAQDGWTLLPNESFIKLNVPEENRQHAEEFLISVGARPDSLRIAIGAGASYGSAKCWPPDRFAELANRLQVQSGAEVILFGTSSEAPVSSAIAAGMRRSPIDLTGKTPISDLPALLSQCHLFIGNDSGAMHVAAAVGLPVVAVFGPTDPLRHRPGNAAMQHRSGKTILQSVFSAPLPHGSPVHDARYARRCRSGRAAVDFVDGGASCLKPAHSAPPFFSIATAPFPKKSAT